MIGSTTPSGRRVIRRGTAKRCSLARAFSTAAPRRQLFGRNLYGFLWPPPTLTLGRLRLADLDAETRRRLEAILPSYVGVQNPVDCTFDLDPPQLREIIAAGLQSSAIGSFIVVLQAELLQGYVGELKEIDFRGRPLLVCVPCKEFAINEVIAMEQAGFPVYTTPEGAVAALSAMQRYALSRACPAQ